MTKLKSSNMMFGRTVHGLEKEIEGPSITKSPNLQSGILDKSNDGGQISEFKDRVKLGRIPDADRAKAYYGSCRENKAVFLVSWMVAVPAFNSTAASFSGTVGGEMNGRALDIGRDFLTNNMTFSLSLKSFALRQTARACVCVHVLGWGWKTMILQSTKIIIIDESP